MSEIITVDGPKEITHKDVKQCENCHTLVREDPETGIWYEKNEFGTWDRHDCSLP